MPPYPALLYFFTLYSFTLTFSTFTYAFFQKTPSLDAPGWIPGAVAPPHPLCTPLVSWELDFKVTFMFSNDKPSYEVIEMQVIQYFVCSLNCNGDCSIFAS